jgi:TonB family protein
MVPWIVASGRLAPRRFPIIVRDKPASDARAACGGVYAGTTDRFPVSLLFGLMSGKLTLHSAVWLCFLLGFFGSASYQPARICAAILVSKVEPTYPIAAKRRRIQGAVRLDIVIGKDGHVLSVTPISGNSLLVDAAKQATLQWVYKPTLLNGQPVVVIMEVCVPFVLPQPTHQKSPCGTARSRCGYQRSHRYLYPGAPLFPISSRHVALPENRPAAWACHVRTVTQRPQI